MAGSVQPRRGRRSGYNPMYEINVTPFVDVMLVLLVVFMVTAPLLTVGVPVDLPQTEARTMAEPDEPADRLDYGRWHDLCPGKALLSWRIWCRFLSAITDANAEARIFVRGDQDPDLWPDNGGTWAPSVVPDMPGSRWSRKSLGPRRRKTGRPESDTPEAEDR